MSRLGAVEKPDIWLVQNIQHKGEKCVITIVTLTTVQVFPFRFVILF